MLGRTHAVCGLLTSVIYINAAESMSSPVQLAVIGVGFLGGLIPDIDHPGSKISKKLKPVSKLVSLLFSHRGLFHTPVLYLALWGLILLQSPAAAAMAVINSLFLGIASHLLLDSLNPAGIPLLFPVYNRRISFAKIRTGGIGEILIESIWGIAALASFFSLQSIV